MTAPAAWPSPRILEALAAHPSLAPLLGRLAALDRPRTNRIRAVIADEAEHLDPAAARTAARALLHPINDTCATADDAAMPDVGVAAGGVVTAGVGAMRDGRAKAAGEGVAAAGGAMTGGGLAADDGVVAVGLALVGEFGTEEDVPLVAARAGTTPVGRVAIEALLRLPGGVDEVARIAEGGEGPGRRLRRFAARAIALGDEEVAAWWTRRNGHRNELAASTARSVAERIGLAALLAGPDCPDDALDGGAGLLLSMGLHNDYAHQINLYADARRAYRALADRFATAAPTPERYALLVSVVEELYSGPAAALTWSRRHDRNMDSGRDRSMDSDRDRDVNLGRVANVDPRREENLDSGREEDVGGRLRAVLARPEWRATVEGLSPQRRAWARDALDRLEAAGTAAAAAGTFRLHVVAGDPGRTGATVETRVLVDGRPLIAERFDKGGGEPPERVLDGRLRPGSPLTSAPDAKQIDWGAGRRCSCFAQPTDQVRQNPDVIHRGVRLAEAYCTEGCCGALYVTVDRDGPDVVWREGGGLRDVEGGVSPDGEGGVSPDALLRMPADVYEAELVRASADRGWEWPGRALARLLMARLREEPGIVGRWGCGPTWAVSRGGEEERGLVRLALEYPAGGCLLHDERWRQIRREWTVGPEPVGEQLERIVTELAATDPRVEG